MAIQKILISNFKCFGESPFVHEFNPRFNIIVGQNEAGKSTILEAIHLCLTGAYRGKYLQMELTQSLFNNSTVTDYLERLDTPRTISPPTIIIELFLSADIDPTLKGSMNELSENAYGISLKIAFDLRYRDTYNALVKEGDVKSLPIEFYHFEWHSFGNNPMMPRLLPFKSALIDSSGVRFKNGSDIYLSTIIKDSLDLQEIVKVSQAHRKMKDVFKSDESIKQINEKMQQASKMTDKTVELSVELSTKNAWERSLVTYLDDVPFHDIGKGEQALLKTRLAIASRRGQRAGVLLIEEPENHLSHSKLNQLISDLEKDTVVIEESGHGEAVTWEKQVIMSTHSSYVSNKLGLENLVLLKNHRTIRFSDLDESDNSFFRKLAGYDTLRMILCDHAILVEGDSDELIMQRLYMDHNKGRLPIHDRIDIISVGTSFKRFLSIAKELNSKITVVTDNDGSLEALKSKYEDYLPPNQKENIKICFDENVNERTELNGEKFNHNTLEPLLLRENNLQLLNQVLCTSFANNDVLLKYMNGNKTTIALKVFDANQSINYPKYMKDAFGISHE